MSIPSSPAFRTSPSQSSKTRSAQASNSNQNDDLPSQVTKYLNWFTEADHIQYESDYAENFSGYVRDQYIKNIQSETGFVYQPSKSDAYLYTGDDPASALKRLINHKPLLLDCRLAKDLAILLAILDNMGLKKFNNAIQTQCHGQLSISLECCQKLLDNNISIEDFAKGVVEGKDNLDKLTNLKVGDIIYIMIPEAKLVHPCSDYIGYHLVCNGFNSCGLPLFVGFGVSQKEAEPIEFYTKIITEQFSNNLSYNDLLSIYGARLNYNRLELTNLSYSGFFSQLIGEALTEFDHRGKSGKYFIHHFSLIKNIFIDIDELKGLQKLNQLRKSLKAAINFKKSGNMKELNKPTSYKVPANLIKAKCKLISITRFKNW